MYVIGEEELKAVREVIESRQFMRYRGGEGGFTEKFEKAVCDQYNVNHALTMNSGTSALICAMVALGIGPGDEVIVPAYTWVATAIAPLAVGAVPVLADVNETMTIDPADIERKITPQTKAVIPVHMINRPCDMDAIMEVAGRCGIAVCEDACQAVGLSYKGRRLGTIGGTGAFSFNLFKNISCGEGGMLLADDDAMFERALMFHDAGCFTRDHASSMTQPIFPGMNFRVSEIQGAILGEQFKRLDPILENLREKTKVMREKLSSSKVFKVSPENDSENTLGLCLNFETKEAAEAFTEEHGVGMLINSGRHVYMNWDPVVNRECFHPMLNPWSFAKRDIQYTPETCPKTLDILSRTCNISVGYDSTVEDVLERAEKLLKNG